MPVMMGPQATRIIRNEYNYTGVILGVTGNRVFNVKNILLK
jgi:hypothetical protein